MWKKYSPILAPRPKNVRQMAAVIPMQHMSLKASLLSQRDLIFIVNCSITIPHFMCLWSYVNYAGLI